MDQYEHYLYLYKKYLNGNCSKDEFTVLIDYIKSVDDNDPIIEGIRSEFDSDRNNYGLENDINEILPKLDVFVQEKIVAHSKTAQYIRWIPYAAALLLVCFGIYFYQREKSNSKDLHSNPISLASQINPGKNRAIIQIANGKRFTMKQNLVMENRKDGSSQFDIGDKHIQVNGTVTVQTPRAGQYQIILMDGTKVWLNAESKLTYPSVFASDKRSVTLIGEAYFEVQPDAKHPFFVNTATETIRVMGTHFNVMAYPKEQKSSVSLIEGKVQVSNQRGNMHTLKPNQQWAQQNTSVQLLQIDPAEVLAWKNGEFMFNKVPLEEVMRSIDRWYDTHTEISPNLRKRLIWGSISRSDQLDKVLQLIQFTDENIKIKMEGRRITMMY